MKICIATGTRAEYGLLKPFIDLIREDDSFDLQILVTGAHLSPEFGLTYQQIETDGLEIDAKVEMLLSSDTARGIVKSMGLGLIGFADAIDRLNPDLLVILGDRYEMLAVASTALIFNIPIAHLHGGEITEGAYDDAIRHAITKMSHLHFTSTESYRQRIIQLGEHPDRVFNVGAIGLDNIANLPLLSENELSEALNVTFLKYNYLVTFHPQTIGEQAVESQFQSLLEVISAQENSFFIFTKANADTDGRIINRMIDAYVVEHPEIAVAITSMGQLRYLSAMKYTTAVVGNSSSGIIEAASFGVPVINIGDRQKGRICGENVLHVPANAVAIAFAFNKVNDPTYRQTLSGMQNPYGAGDTAKKILNVIKQTKPKLLLQKHFYNIENEIHN